MSHNNNNILPTTMTADTDATGTIATTSTYFTYSIPGMDIAPGPFIFTCVSEFLSLITPEELPLESVRELLHGNLTFIDFASNAIKVESGFIALFSIFAILAFVPLFATCAWCCCKGKNDNGDVEFTRSSSHAPVIMIDDTLQETLHCRRKASVITLWIVFIFLALSDLCIFYANSRLAASIEMTPEMVKSTMHDMEVFLKDTHLQIKHKLDNGFHVSVEKVVKDLEDVDVLLGEPIQAEISANTGIELAYDSLATISLANAELIYRVLMLQETVGRALKISQEAAARMEELQIQLSVLQRQCTYRDRPLCDTLRIRSFEENGIIDALKTLQEDQTIFRMRYLGEIEFGATVKNLTSEVGVSRSIFSNFPQQVKHDTSYQRNYTLEQLDNIRQRTTSNVQMLTATINTMLDRFKGTWDWLQPHYNQLQDWTNKYWTIGWVTALVIIWVMLFMLMSYCCSLCEANVKAGIVLFMATIIVCMGSMLLTLYGMLTLAIGGNSQIFVCRAFYETHSMDAMGMSMGMGSGIGMGSGSVSGSTVNNYIMLGKLFDKPGYVYAQEPQGGIIGELLRPAGVNHPIVKVTLAEALRGCEQNEASYNVFQLDAFVNTTKIADLKQFPKVSTAIDEIDVSERTLLSLTQTIQNILDNMLQTSSFNMTTYRTSVSAPTPEKDLATFIEQMQRVALQIQDVATSSRMTTLGSRAKRLQASILQPLEQLQNEILYHLTALELQRDPWAKQVNQTLNHLRNIQGYLERTAGEICHNQTRHYTQRLKNYLTSSKATMSSQLGDTTAKCRPFYDIFDANRIFFCRNIVDYVNGLWFFTFLTLLLWSIGTPVALNLINLQRKINNLAKTQRRVIERTDSRDRRSEREPRTRGRDRSTSSTRRAAAATTTTSGRPTLRRSATEETLDIADDSPQRLDERYQRDQRSMERDVSRSREMSRARDTVQTTTTTTTTRGRPQLRRTGTDTEEIDDNWGTSSRPSSHERERARDHDRDHERERTRERSVDRESGQMQRRIFSSIMQRGKPKPTLRKQGTEEEELEDDDNWRSNQEGNRDGNRRQGGEQMPAGRSRQKLREQQQQHGSRERMQRDRGRSTTPVLQARADAQPATPLPRTPTHLRSRVSLTTRAVQDIVSKRNRRLNRDGSEDYDMDMETDAYGATLADSAAIAAARRTPPRGAPPPPPPPTGMMNREQGSMRNIHWSSDNPAHNSNASNSFMRNQNYDDFEIEDLGTEGYNF